MMQIVASAVMTKGRVSLQLNYTESTRRIAKATLWNFITECYSDAYGSDHAVNNQLADERDTVLRVLSRSFGMNVSSSVVSVMFKSNIGVEPDAGICSD